MILCLLGILPVVVRAHLKYIFFYSNSMNVHLTFKGGFPVSNLIESNFHGSFQYTNRTELVPPSNFTFS